MLGQKDSDFYIIFHVYVHNDYLVVEKSML
jgi:hypothetical protein